MTAYKPQSLSDYDKQPAELSSHPTLLTLRDWKEESRHPSCYRTGAALS